MDTKNKVTLLLVFLFPSYIYADVLDTSPWKYMQNIDGSEKNYSTQGIESMTKVDTFHKDKESIGHLDYEMKDKFKTFYNEKINPTTGEVESTSQGIDIEW